MAQGINLTAALRANLSSLQNTSALTARTQNRLATGLEVNSALDDPNAFFASQALSNRAGDLNKLLDGIGQSIQVLKAADQGLTTLTTLVEQAQSIAETARDQTSSSAIDTGNVLAATTGSTDIQGAGVVTTADTFTLQAGPDAPVTQFTIAAGQTLDDLATEINKVANLTARVIIDDDAGTAQLEVRTTDGSDLIAAEGTNTPLANLGLNVGTTVATNQPPEDRAELESNYNEIRSQIDELIQDTGYRGTNLLGGDSLAVQFNEDNSSNLDIAGVTFDTAATGLNVSAAIFDGDANIQASLDELVSSLDSIRSTARTFGNNLATIQTREEFTKGIVSTLQEGSDKLVLADLNEEGANLLALQTAQQLGTTSLSLASQAQQAVLSLF